MQKNRSAKYDMASGSTMLSQIVDNSMPFMTKPSITSSGRSESV